MTGSAQTCTNAPAGMVGWWRAENDARDTMSGSDGTLINGVGFSSGKVGQAFAFDGIDDAILVSNSPALNFGAGQDFSIEAWVRPEASATTFDVMTIVDARLAPDDLHGVGYEVALIGGQLECRLSDSFANGGTSFGAAGPDLRDGNFHHVAVTIERSSIFGGHYYVDGVLVLTFNPTVEYGDLSSGQPLRIGVHPTPSVFANFKGRMDELTIYNRALGQTEIQSIYQAGAGGKCYVSAPPAILAGNPADQSVSLSNNATFRVFVTGTSPFSYQWKFNQINLPGATNSALIVSNALPSNAGVYSVAVTNTAGFAVSSNVLLQVRSMAAFGNGLALTNTTHIFNTNVTVELQNFFANGLIFYTLDGSTPTFLSTQYGGPFLLTHSVMLRAIAYSADFFEAGEADPISILIPPSYPLLLGSGGGGIVTANPTPGPYLSNTMVTLTATPNAGWTFLQWLGDASGNSTVTNITMTRAKTAQAIFGTTLGTSAAPLGGGTVTLNPPGGIYPYGTTVQLSAVPSAGNYFALWGNAGSGNVSPLAFVVTNAKPTVSSLFSAVAGEQAALTVVPVGLGSISVSPRANVYSPGSGVTITATPDAGQSFIGWNGDASGIQNPLVLTLDSNKLIYANFTRRPQLVIRNSAATFVTEGVQLTLTGGIGDHYELDSSTNLSVWTALAVLTNSAGTVPFTDTNGSSAGRIFYRSLTMP